MTGVPGGLNIPGGGSRQQRAAQLKAELESKSTAGAQAPTDVVHEVQPGETIDSIADRYQQSPQDIWEHPQNEQIWQDRGSFEDLRPGDRLSIPAEKQLETGPVGQGDYEIKQGDCISSIAKNSGHVWATIWNEPGNAVLRQVRQDANILLPEDRLTIPAVRKKQEPGETEMRHRFVRRGEPSLLRLKFMRGNEPRANEPYQLTIDDQTFSGTTQPDGRVEVRIPGNARKGKISIGSGEDQDEYPLNLGKMDPITEISGIQARLNNLAFDCGGTSGRLNETTEAALFAFQRAHDLTETGRPDDQTRAKLREVHGS